MVWLNLYDTGGSANNPKNTWAWDPGISSDQTRNLSFPHKKHIWCRITALIFCLASPSYPVCKSSVQMGRLSPFVFQTRVPVHSHGAAHRYRIHSNLPLLY